MEARLLEVNEAKRIEDETKHREEEVRQRNAIDASADEQRKRNDRIRQLEAAQDDETPLKKKGTSKHVKFTEEPAVTTVKQEAPKVAETLFAHLKVKKPEQQAQTVQKVAVEAKLAEKEETKTLTQKEQANEPNRKQRKHDQYLKD